jgi:hypothetical protein
MLRSIAPLGLSLLLMACGAAGVTSPAKAPETTPAPAPGAETSQTAAKAAPAKPLAELPPGIPEASADCPARANIARVACGPHADFTLELARALASGGAEQDRLLGCLESATEAPPGLVRALRADLGPRGCGDVTVGDGVVAGAPREIADVLVALGVGARLYRSVREPPLPRPPFDKAAFLKHFKETLSPWIVQQAHAVDVLSQVGPRLSGYAKGIVALEAGLADMRFVAIARAIELPAEMKNDPEIRETYLVALEQALEPRVARGRDAALVGLAELSRQGITKDLRLDEARGLLSQLFAGRRIDALDRLLLPTLPALTVDTPALSVAAKLPAFYALKLDAAPSISDAKLLRARLEQGVPPALWLAGAASPASPELAALTQRGLFQLGQAYFWAEPFARAAAIDAPANDSNAALLAALAKVLARGPRNAAALMLGPPTLPPELRDTSGVDALSKQKGPVAGLAEFDAAYLRGLAPPANDPAFWKEQAARYQRAQKKLDAPHAKLAADLRKAAADTEKELLASPKP